MIDLQTARLHLAFGSLLVLGLVAVAGGRWLTGRARRRRRAPAARSSPGALELGLVAAQGCVRGDVPRAARPVLAPDDDDRARPRRRWRC